MKLRKYAAVDIGSNAIRLLIMHSINYSGGVHYKKVSLVRVPIRLGQDVFTQGKISERNKDRLVESMNAFKSLIFAHEVDQYRACATSAMRDASNGEEIAALVGKESGINIEVISGKEEADIIYSTHIENLIDSDRNYLYVDVGGGSTEMTLFVNGQVEDSRSFNIGTIRLLNDLVSQKEWQTMEQWLKNHHANLDELEAIGSGGNINRIYKMNLKNNWKPLTKKELIKSRDLIQGMSYEERLIQLNMNIDRADVVLHATNIFMKVCDWAKIKHIHVPKMGLSDGLVRQMHERHMALETQ